jgi:hypothetical protein
MKKQKLGLLAFIGAILFSSQELTVSAEVNNLTEFNQMKERQLQTEGNGLGSNPSMREGVAQNYDSACLSNKDCYVALKVSIPFDGIFKIEKLIGKNDTPEDDFYCEQAVWDFAFDMGGRHGPGEVLCEFYGKPNSGSGTHPELKSLDSSRVYLHLAPQSRTKYENDLDTSKDLVSIDASKIASPRLDEFRREWLRFLFSPPNPALPTGRMPIREKQVEMLNKYHDLLELQNKKADGTI